MGTRGLPILATTFILAFASTGYAQTSVTLTDTSQTTTLTANVSEQARVTVPSGVTFNVNNVAAATAASAASVSVTGIVLATATKQFRVSLQANAASFTAPGGATTWSASDVTWNAAAWTNATGTLGTLSSAAYSTVATCASGRGGLLDYRPRFYTWRQEYREAVGQPHADCRLEIRSIGS